MSPADDRTPTPWLLPVIAWQGHRVRRTTVVLPEADGPRTGSVPAGGLGAAASTAAADPVRLLVLGESTAVGVGVARQSDGLAGRLAQRLAATTGRPVTWTVVGRSGATLRRIRHRLLPEVVASPGGYDVIVLLAGVNDVLARTAPAAWALDMRALRDGLLPLLAPTGRVVLTGVPSFLDFPSLPRPLSAYLDARGRALDARTATLAGDRVVWASSREIMAAAPEGAEAIDPAARFAADGFHPGPPGYVVWADALAARL